MNIRPPPPIIDAGYATDTAIGYSTVLHKALLLCILPTPY